MVTGTSMGKKQNLAHDHVSASCPAVVSNISVKLHPIFSQDLHHWTHQAGDISVLFDDAVNGRFEASWVSTTSGRCPEAGQSAPCRQGFSFIVPSFYIKLCFSSFLPTFSLWCLLVYQSASREKQASLRIIIYRHYFIEHTWKILLNPLSQNVAQ